MTNAVPGVPAAGAPDRTPPRRGHPRIAWAVILAVVGLIVYRNALPAPADAAAWLVPMRMQSRYLVGAANSGLPGMTGKPLLEQAKQSLNGGPFAKRLRFAVVAGELGGPGEALAALAELRSADAPSPSPRSTRMAGLLERLYTGYAADHGAAASLSPPDREEVRDGLGWFGDLALTPAGSDPEARARVLAPARRTFFGGVTFALAAGLGLLIGGYLLLLLIVMAYVGRLSGRGRVATGHGGVYAETFAAYLSLFVGLSYAARLLPLSSHALWVSAVVMLASLATLAWPVLRGVPWAEVRRDLGLRSDGVLRDVAVGVGTYLTALPLLAVGVVVMILLTYAQRRLGLAGPGGTDGAPSHPISGVALSGSWWVWAQVFILASVLAPLVEETMFRGTLYQHLREARPGLPWWGSVAFATLVSGLVFAAIHPQGWLAVPPLFALATAFALAREWRGSLLPGMVAHGINNAVVTLVLYTLAA